MDKAITQILESGILGALLVVSGTANVYQYIKGERRVVGLEERIAKIQGERMADYKEIVTKSNEAQGENRTLLQRILDYLQGAQ